MKKITRGQTLQSLAKYRNSNYYILYLTNTKNTRERLYHGLFHSINKTLHCFALDLVRKGKQRKRKRNPHLKNLGINNFEKHYVGKLVT